MKPKIEQIFDEKVTINDIKEFEKEFNLSLPESYKTFLLENNGGNAEPDFYYLSDEKCVGISSFYTLEEIKSDLTDFSLKFTSNIVPIAIDGGGNIICISASGEDKGKLYLWWAENCADEDEEATYDNLSLIADNFDEFINNFVDFNSVVPPESYK